MLKNYFGWAGGKTPSRRSRPRRTSCRPRHPPSRRRRRSSGSRRRRSGPVAPGGSPGDPQNDSAIADETLRDARQAGTRVGLAGARGVTQPGSAPGSGPGCRRFEFSRPRLSRLEFGARIWGSSARLEPVAHLLTIHRPRGRGRDCRRLRSAGSTSRPMARRCSPSRGGEPEVVPRWAVRSKKIAC